MINSIVLQFIMGSATDIEDFEKLLENHANATTNSFLYKNNKVLCTKRFKPVDVISCVSSQLKAIQNADLISHKHLRGNVERPSSFLLVHEQPKYEKITHNTNTNKFETQCFSDTQLINVIEDAERSDVKNGITQEFNDTFHQSNTIKHEDNVFDNNTSKVSRDTNIGNLKTDISNKNEIRNDILDTEEKYVHLIHYDIKNNIVTSQDDIEIGKDTKILSICPVEDTDVSVQRPVSPILNHIKPLKIRSSPVPLTVDLETFERFEKTIVPLIEYDDNIDWNSTKHFINSQIISKQLNLYSTEHIVSINDKCDRSSKLGLQQMSFQVENIDQPLFQQANEPNTGIIDDDILFSSDEETNYMHKDLPFTCALETSFFNNSGILDKTLYVGFQTASNKSIQVCTESFHKAKSFMNKEMSLNDLVNVCDDSYKMNDINDMHVKNINKSLEQINQNKVFEETYKDNNETNINNKNKSMCNSKNLDRFATRINEKDNLSDHPSEKCTDVFSNINISTNLTEIISSTKKLCNKTEIFETTSKNCDEKVAECTQEKINDDSIIQEFENYEMSLEMTDKDKNTSIDFKTASNSNTIGSYSAISILKPNNVLQNIDKFENLTKNNIEDVRLDRKDNVSPKFYSKDSDKFMDVYKSVIPTEFVGFKTASNKNINISENALAKTKNILQDFELISSANTFNTDTKQDLEANCLESKEITSINNQIEPMPTFKGFMTASNKNITISEHSMRNTKHVFKDIDLHLQDEDAVNANEYLAITNNNQPSTSQRSLKLKTANNKNISMSDKGLKAADHIFNDVDGISDVKMKSKRNLKITAQPLVKSNTVFESDGDIKLNHKVTVMDDKCFVNQMKKNALDEITSDFKYNNQSFKGFMTASNKQVKVSADALAKSKQIFESINADPLPFEDRIKKISPVLSGKTMLNNDKANYAVFTDVNQSELSKICVPEYSNETNCFKGFTTASNKPVQISAEALAKSKKIFDSISTDPLQVENNEKYVDATSIEAIISEDDKITSMNVIDQNKNKLTKDNTSEYKNDIDVQVTTVSNEPFKTSESLGGKILDDVNIKEPIKKPIFSEFQGFKTANNKSVKVSKEAIEKTKQIFKDLETTNNLNVPSTFNSFQTANNKAVTVSQKAMLQSKTRLEVSDGKQRLAEVQGFHTPSNKNVEISHEALAKSKLLFKDIDEVCVNNTVTSPCVPVDDVTTNKRNIKISDDITESRQIIKTIEVPLDPKKNTVNTDEKVNELNIDNIIDTQVIDNFEETLYSEDFCKETPQKSKRSGSPILSCPKAKKRKKFETPFSSSKLKLKNEHRITCEKAAVKEEKCNALIFDDSYKKLKKYSLKDLRPDKNQVKIDLYLLHFDFDSLLEFEFYGKTNDINDEKLCIRDLNKVFMDSVKAKLIPEGWLENHTRLILWKLISYDIKFNLGVCTARNLLQQLKFRYDKELYNAERPALRKILEKDDVPSKTMVLCVAGIYVDGVKFDSVTTSTNNVELLLTDGWYCIKASLDRMLVKFVIDKRIQVGSKLVTNGAELIGCEQGMAPWEDTSSVRLKLFGNSTRRARWDARLGFHGNAAILSQLSAVTVEGGRVSKLRVYVARVYPTLYVEKFEDGSTVTRSERLELSHQMKHETERQAMLEKLYEEVEKEFEYVSQDSEYTDSGNKRKSLDSGSQIAKMMKKCKDPVEFRSNLTSSQTTLLQQYSNVRRDRLLQDIQNKIEEKIKTSELNVNRNVIPLMKIRIAGFGQHGATKGMMSIWKPNDAISELITEGAWIDVMNVAPTAVRCSEIQISAGRQSVFSRSKYKESEEVTLQMNTLKRVCYSIRNLVDNPNKITEYNEIDTVGMIFLIDPSIQQYNLIKDQTFQNVYLTDAGKNMICINFWGGIKKFGYENVLDTGQIVACSNLQKRAGNTRKTIPQYRVTEFTTFTKSPKSIEAKEAMDNLNKQFMGLDRRKFCNDCVILKDNYLNKKIQSENISPYRFNNSDYNLSKHKVFIETPLASKHNRLEDFNLTGLDFESTFRQDTQDLSPQALQRKKRVYEKISRLKMYGEPPPLSPIHIINKSKNATRDYKSPFLKPKSESVASVENISKDITKVNNTVFPRSPVLPTNRTFIKRNCNPIKLNFSNDPAKDESSSNVIDQFAEEFDGSPPLSLE